MSDLQAALTALLAKRFNGNMTEVNRRMAIIRPLWDEKAINRFSANELSGDALVMPLQTALNRRDLVDAHIVAVSISALIPGTLSFATDHANEEHAIRYRASAYEALRSSTQTTFMELLHASIPGGIFRASSGLTNLPEMEHARYHIMGTLLCDYPRPTVEQIRLGLLHTYLDFSLNEATEGAAKRIERICEIATTKAVPYGLRHERQNDPRTTFFLITG